MNDPKLRFQDLMAAIVSVTCLVALVLPALPHRREHARSAVCKNALRQLGIHFFTYADRDPKGRFSTGAPDYLRNGSLDTYGWVADVVNANNGLNPHCTTNSAKGLATLIDMIESGVKDGQAGVPAARLQSGIAAAKDLSGVRGGPESSFAGTSAGSPERQSLVARTILDRGYNTNYTASWFLTQGGPRIKFDQARNRVVVDGPAGKRGLQGVRGTLGPLTIRMIEVSPIPASNIPFLADGAAQAESPYNIGYGPKLSDGKPDPFSTGPQEKPKTRIKKGAGLVIASNRGPAQWDEQTKRLEEIASDADLTEQIRVQNNARRIPGTKLSKTYLQDTRGWSAVHVSFFRKRSINMLMGDGSVKDIADTNKDTLVNPGFPIAKGTQSKDGRRLYADGTGELRADTVFNGVFLQEIKLLRSFD